MFRVETDKLIKCVLYSEDNESFLYPAQVKLQFTMKYCHVFNRVKFVDNQEWESLGDKTFFCKFLKTNIVTGTNAF